MECPKDFENIILNAVGRHLIHTRQNLLASKEKQKDKKKTQTNWCPDRTEDYSKVKLFAYKINAESLTMDSQFIVF